MMEIRVITVVYFDPDRKTTADNYFDPDYDYFETQGWSYKYIKIQKLSEVTKYSLYLVNSLTNHLFTIVSQADFLLIFDVNEDILHQLREFFSQTKQNKPIMVFSNIEDHDPEKIIKELSEVIDHDNLNQQIRFVETEFADLEAIIEYLISNRHSNL